MAQKQLSFIIIGEPVVLASASMSHQVGDHPLPPRRCLLQFLLPFSPQLSRSLILDQLILFDSSGFLGKLNETCEVEVGQRGPHPRALGDRFRGEVVEDGRLAQFSGFLGCFLRAADAAEAQLQFLKGAGADRDCPFGHVVPHCFFREIVPRFTLSTIGQITMLPHDLLQLALLLPPGQPWHPLSLQTAFLSFVDDLPHNLSSNSCRVHIINLIRIVLAFSEAT
jgi:hypothetical protein